MRNFTFETVSFASLSSISESPRTYDSIIHLWLDHSCVIEKIITSELYVWMNAINPKPNPKVPNNKDVLKCTYDKVFLARYHYKSDMSSEKVKEKNHCYIRGKN